MNVPTVLPASLALSVVLVAAGAAPAAAQTVKMTDNGVNRSIDCKGGDLSVTGDGDTLAVTGCIKINVIGNRNQMTVKLLPESVIAALGDNNHIVFAHAPGFEARATSTGNGNEIVPQMTRDLQFKSTVKYPIAPH